MAGLALVLNKIETTLPRLSFIIQDSGHLVGFQHHNGVVTYFPASDGVSGASAPSAAVGSSLIYKNNIVTSAVASGKVTLPPCKEGMKMLIGDESGQVINIISSVGDVAVSFNIGAGTIYHYAVGMADGRWAKLS